ncbi:MAG: ABC transporter ATP-binding protein/permease [Oscillospiraceae bacterium]|nr:ABC transporter ATP-binding protein/permease [Oscillospiraceae bacterium]
MEQSKDTLRRGYLMAGIRDAISLFWNGKKSILFICGLAVVMRVALPYLGILMPSVVIDQITAQVSPQTFFITVGAMAVLLVIVNYVKSFTDTIANNAIGTLTIGLTMGKQLQKLMNMDYEIMEDPAYKEVQDKADKALNSNHAPAMNIPRTLVELLSNSFGFLLYAGVIAIVHPLILLVLIVTAFINWLMLKRAKDYLKKSRDERSKLYKTLDALSKTLRDPEAAKDIRLYGAIDWLQTLYRRQFSLSKKAERKLISKDMHAQITDALMILLRDGAAYAFLIWLVLQDQLTLGDFVLVFGAIGGLATWVSGILTASIDLSRACVERNDIIEQITYPDRMNTGKGIALPTGAELPPSIELKDVSYTYPKAEKPTLKDINLRINAGERIAIVGANGAGKTTLIKLICGLYLPTAGEISLNNNPVSKYNRDEYYTLFSAVFQDIHMLSASIAENISQATPELTDHKKVLKCLELTGLIEKTNSLPDKGDTLLVREVNADGAELSGGEKQKLAMARALYKNAPVIILDEPTAALDPIAENEIYRQYADLTEGTTSIYISHRLASTRFCDRILMIDGNIISEQGTHDELMALGGTYAKMFEIQASYYQEGDGNGFINGNSYAEEGAGV